MGAEAQVGNVNEEHLVEFCPIPFNDEARARAVKNLPGLADLDHPAVDAICDATRLLFDCPTALVSAIAEDSQWLPSAVGIEREEISRRISLCSYTIMSDEVMVVPDLSLDPKFATHPMVTKGGPQYRFYAGVPLILSSGFRIGSLCALDTKPHEMPSQSQLDILRKLGEAVVASFEKPPAASAEDDNETLRSNFAILVGHELRTPMTIVLGGLNLLEHKTQGSTVNQIASKARKASEHLGNLIETIIKFSVAETGDLVLNEQPTCISRIISETIELVSIAPEAQRKSIIVNSVPEPGHVLVDPDHIRLSLTALMMNSVLHGGDEISITTRLDPDGAVRIEVADDGDLDDHVELAELYQPFVVGGDLSKRGTRGGLGLGLPLTRKLVEMHGGKFEVLTAPNRTIASIRLPHWRIVE
ncbi:histidine kinase [Sulfitobacter sp. HI0082]|nr:histidine kinase [Sulfitobacter sp. HI0082]